MHYAKYFLHVKMKIHLFEFATAIVLTFILTEISNFCDYLGNEYTSGMCYYRT